MKLGQARPTYSRPTVGRLNKNSRIMLQQVTIKKALHRCEIKEPIWKMKSEGTLMLWTEWLNNLTLVRAELRRVFKKKVKWEALWDKFNNRLIGLLQIPWASWLEEIWLGRASNLLPQIINRTMFELQGPKGLANSSEELTATRTCTPESHTLQGSCKPSLDQVEAFKLWNLLVRG